ncbi:hypothetical protein [Thermomonospora umbrina]|uniref:Uncharacterized protein n=1 Tax=Thermomonospora umbrina TaxID=111806 RepID=A0A3D9SWR4_9ACTN|nr:hypothetical protein [Thermomonospora umbrina]REF00279.1 hypothetical protein DFJ69_5808 [Thermomonospora umbrina]
MSIGFRAAASGSGGNSVSVTIPAGVQAGDSLLLMVYVNTDCTITTPSGWQVAKAQQQAEAGGATAAIFKRLAQTGDASTNAVSTNDGAAGVKAGALLIAHSGTDTVDPVHAINSRLDTGGTASVPTPAVTTGVDGCWVVEMCTTKSSTTTVWSTVPAGSTSRVSLIGTGGGHVDGAVADRGPVTPGGYGGGTFTQDANQSSAISYTIALAPKTSTQTLRPVSDVTVGSYTAVPTPGAGVALASRIGEAVRDDNSYIQTPNAPSAAVYEARLAAGQDPLSSDDHTVTVVLSTAGGATSSSCAVALVQGTTVIRSQTFTDVPATPTVYTIDLTGAEADAITDYADLRIRFTWTAA